LSYPDSYRKVRRLLDVTAAMLLVWAAAGFVDGMRFGMSGGLYDPSYHVPVTQFGLVADDRVISVEGIPVEKLGMESRWPRSLAPAAGATRRFVVERQGSLVAVDVVFPAPSQSVIDMRVSGLVIGLSFLAFGLWGLWTAPSEASLCLGEVGLAIGAAFSLGLGPNLGWWNGVQSHLSTAALALGCLLLLKFFLLFPQRRPLVGNIVALSLLWGPWFALLAGFVLELAFHPTLYYATSAFAYPLMMVYLALTLLAFAYSFSRHSRRQAWESGLHWILGSLLVSGLAVLVPLDWGLGLRGWSYTALFVLVPWSMAAAVRRQAR